MLGLYVHIPFCNSICSYCDFPKEIAKQEKKQVYIQALIKEIESYKIEKKSIRSVYLGGGTPNCLDDFQLEAIFQALEPFLRESKENTIEINSELLTKKQAELFKKYGINRVSIGVQTFQKKILEEIRRKHSSQLVSKAMKILNEVGISNVNIDLMIGLPKQTLAMVKKDLRHALKLKPTHLSCYTLIHEEKTLLDFQLKHHQISLPDDDYVAKMAIYVNQFLKKKGFHHYEISNYALPGYESIHNIGYWKAEEYIGVGAGAAGYIGSVRYQNHRRIKEYIKDYRANEERISLDEKKNEFMMLGLRMLDGISIQEYYKRFQTYPKDDFDLDKLIKNGLLEVKNDIICLNEDKYLVANLVFEEFVR